MSALLAACPPWLLHGILAGVFFSVLGAAASATSQSTRISHPRLSDWLRWFAAALPADVARMQVPAAPPKAIEPPPDLTPPSGRA